MENVVLTHNTLNELTWRAIQRWEKLHPETEKPVKLNRFIGRPDELSPLAYLRQLMGGPRPFDRHDWYLIRDGHEVRYVIDFYFDESKAGSPEVRILLVNTRLCRHPGSP
jgi:cytochrome c heme-lyase